MVRFLSDYTILSLELFITPLLSMKLRIWRADSGHWWWERGEQFGRYGCDSQALAIQDALLHALGTVMVMCEPEPD